MPELLHSVPGPEVFSRRQQTQVVWDQYLSSVEKIVLTTLTIIQVGSELSPISSIAFIIRREFILTWLVDPGYGIQDPAPCGPMLPRGELDNPDLKTFFTFLMFFQHLFLTHFTY